MLGLILRLSHLDADAAGAVRVIAYFDRLVEHRASLHALVRSTAGLAECPAGLRDHHTGRVIRYGPDGRTLDTAVQPTIDRSVRVDDHDVGIVWLERPDGDGPLDEMVVERMAVAAGALWPATSHAETMADPALVELAISPSADPADRARGLRLLGFDLHVTPPQATKQSTTQHSAMPKAPRPQSTKPQPKPSQLTMLAIAVAVGEAPDKAAADLARSLSAVRGHVARAAVIGARGVVLTQLRATDETPHPAVLSGAVLSGAVPSQVRLGVGRSCAALDLPRCWQEAVTAARFTGALGFGDVVRFEDLGALSALARIPPDVVEAEPDVRAVRELAATDQGATDLAVLTAYCATRSLRRAADTLHLHHSSVARRLQQVSRRLGLDLERPENLLRAEVALILSHIAAS